MQDDIPFFTCGLFDCDKEKEVQLLEKIKEAEQKLYKKTDNN